MALLPRLELYAVGDDGYADALAEAEDAGTPYGLFVFDGVVPGRAAARCRRCTSTRRRTATFGTVEGRIEGPLIDRTDPDEPILRFVDLTTVHIGRAREVALADGNAIGRRTPAPVVRWWRSASGTGGSSGSSASISASPTCRSRSPSRC